MTDFKKIYDTYSRDVYRFAFHLGGNRDDAMEITAETFARALTGKAPVKSATVKSYLFTIARNFYLESLRKSKRLGELETELAGKENEPEKLLGHKTELEALEKYLTKFPETDRTALLLRADGMSYREISQTLNLTLAASKVKVHRMRLKIAEWRVKREKE